MPCCCATSGWLVAGACGTERRSVFLLEITVHAAVNKMTLENVATVFGPNFLATRDVC